MSFSFWYNNTGYVLNYSITCDHGDTGTFMKL